jgi:hypothetical protein
MTKKEYVFQVSNSKISVLHILNKIRLNIIGYFDLIY